MIFWKSVKGTVITELTGAEPEKTLHTINQAGIHLHRVEWAGELTVRFGCSRSDRKCLEKICQKRGDTLRFVEEIGFVPILKGYLRRPILAAGIFVFLALTTVLPTRVLFFRVEGNETIPARQILEAAGECGIRFGVSRRAVRSEQMKNSLLAAMPELKWAGINTIGCTAVISVREGAMRSDGEVFGGISSIVAARDGYITSCTVTKGNALCSPGQVVKAGQVLISGYTDCGICIQVTQAEGEIYANTNRDVEAVMPSDTMIRWTQKDEIRRFSLIIGKKRINLWKDSGIWDATCGRMYEEYYLTLPGGFRLPVRLAVDTLTAYEIAASERISEELEAELKVFARESVLDQTIAGEILQEDHIMTEEDGCVVLKSRFLCSEMIGRVITEEIGEANGKTD